MKISYRTAKILSQPGEGGANKHIILPSITAVRHFTAELYVTFKIPYIQDILHSRHILPSRYLTFKMSYILRYLGKIFSRLRHYTGKMLSRTHARHDLSIYISTEDHLDPNLPL